MAGEDRPKIIVEELPGGGQHWRRADADTLLKKDDNFPHRMGSPSNFLDLYQRFLSAVEGYCLRTSEGALLIPDEYGAEELNGLRQVFSHRCTAEFMQLEKAGSTPEGFDYHRLAGKGPYFHALVVISQALQLSQEENDPCAVNGEDRRRDLRKGDCFSRGVLDELLRALGILEMHYLERDDAAQEIQEDDDYVTLDQAAAVSKKRKRTLEGYLKDRKLPRPDFEGGNGRASIWKWSRLRPALAPLVTVPLPVRFPSLH